MVEHWDKGPEKLCVISILGVPKTCLDIAPDNLI